MTSSRAGGVRLLFSFALCFYAASAVWSLMANAPAHSFVKAELDRIEKEAAAANAVKAMVALRQPQ
jgi:hypothetical protein